MSLFGSTDMRLPMTDAPHPEDIKAAIRKRHKSVAAFERTSGLPSRSVKDVLQGKSRPSIAQAIANDLGVSVHDLFPTRFSQSPNGDNNAGHDGSHA
jgi:lambda repressor-like predicted transcriptional regulator